MSVSSQYPAVRARERRLNALRRGLCTRCGKSEPRPGMAYCETCATRRRAESGQAWKGRRERNPENCANCFIYPRLGSGHLCDRCFKLKARERHTLKSDVLLGYGGKCGCCGEENIHFLTIDHIDGMAAEVRPEFRVRGVTLYRRLRRAGFPAGFQILCQNCNWAKGVYGTCPHKGEFPTLDNFVLTPRQERTIRATAPVPQRGKYTVPHDEA